MPLVNFVDGTWVWTARMADPLRIFVYGTLQRGWWNHPRYCAGYLEAREATVLGRLYQLPQGYPMVRVPEEAVLAGGTASPRDDAATQARFDRVLSLHPDLGGTAGAGLGGPNLALADAWRPIRGELLTFDDPVVRLRALDRLEGFLPGAASLYVRVLLPAIPEGADGPVAAWTYVAPPGDGEALERFALHLPAGRWPVEESNPRPAPDPLK